MKHSDLINFDENPIIAAVRTKEDFKPGDTDKYTVVIWFEGEDSQCVNDIMGGHMRLSMLFEATELKE